MALVLDLPPGMVIPNEVGGIVFAENSQGLFKLVLLDIAMGGKVSTGGAPGNKILAGQKSKSARGIVIGKMHLGQPERIRVTVYSNVLVLLICIATVGLDLLVSASTLSPM
jgi:hypothetical protein